MRTVTGTCVVRLGDTVVAETRDAYRVLETSHPPTWYLPRDSVSDGVLERSARGVDVVRVERRRDLLGRARRDRGGLVLRDAVTGIRGDHAAI